MDNQIPYDDDAVQQWLLDQGFELGNITQKIKWCSDFPTEKTPLTLAFVKKQISVCKWLIVHGACYKHEDYIIFDNFYNKYGRCKYSVDPEMRRCLYSWAQNIVAVNKSFQIFMLGTYYPEVTSDSLRRTLTATGNDKAEIIIKYIQNKIDQEKILLELRPIPHLVKLRSQSGILEIISEYLGVMHNSKFRNVLKFSDNDPNEYWFKRFAMEFDKNCSNNDPKEYWCKDYAMEFDKEI